VQATDNWGTTTVAIEKEYGLRALSDGEREMLIARLPPHYMIHSFANCFDRDERQPAFIPWTFAFHRTSDRTAWIRNRSQCIRLGTQAVLIMMHRHLGYISEQECKRARAPYKLPKDILRQAFWRVEPRRTGYCSLSQFMQVWQNVLQLWEYSTDYRSARGRRVRVLEPLRRRIVDRNASAAIFARFGFDRNGYMPYEVFIQVLNESPARLLGHELLLNKTMRGKNGVESMVDVAYLIGDAKVDYPKSTMSVFPPSGFDGRLAKRSMKLPRAHLYLEHVYGYAGFNNLANNLFYTHNTDARFNEVVFYVGMLGVVATWIEGDVKFGTRQRFFFGHDNDIQCLGIHPNRRFVCTGQQTSTSGKPYACVWDIGEYTHEDTRRLDSGDLMQMREVGQPRDPVQLQRLEVGKEYRSILAVAFSGNQHASFGDGIPDKRGGQLLITITGDNQHTVHIWRWMIPAELTQFAKDKLVYSHCKAMHIPSWNYGPEKKLQELQSTYKYFCSDDFDGPKRFVPGVRAAHHCSICLPGLPQC
jgi:echinoderm microtubule-associated protein-like 5